MQRISFINIFDKWMNEYEWTNESNVKTCWVFRFAEWNIVLLNGFSLLIAWLRNETKKIKKYFSHPATIPSRSTWNSGPIESRPNYGLSHSNIAVPFFSGHIWPNENAATGQWNGINWKHHFVTFWHLITMSNNLVVSNAITKPRTWTGTLLLRFADHNSDDIGTMSIQSNKRYSSIRGGDECEITFERNLPIYR